MRVNEFVEYMQKNTTKIMKEEQVASMAKKALEVKSYLGIKKKKELVDSIVDECILYESGVFKFDNIYKYICFTMYTLAAYTNLELSSDIEDDFDALSESNLLPLVICLIQKEYDDVNIYLQMQCDSVLENNTIEAQFGKFLEGVVDKLAGVEVALKDYLSGIDISSLLQDKDKIVEFLKSVK